jgi:hypothetical protein
MPPPPPPPNVPDLKDKGANGLPATVRARLEEHRNNPACSGCHVRMDPLGFALENFDPIGAWRTTSDGHPVDVSAALPDGTALEGVNGLRKLLLVQRKQFVRTTAEKLLTYAIGRKVEYYDQPAVRKIVQASAGHDDRWSSLLIEIVKSVPFNMSIAAARPLQARSSAR